MGLFSRRAVDARDVQRLGSAANARDDDGDFLSRLRARVMPSGITAQGPFSYARPFASGLVVVLCVDHPETVETLTDLSLEGRDLSFLFEVGTANTMRESVQIDQEVAPGVRAFAGDSLFVASQVIEMGQVVARHFGAAPHGVVFALPHRHMMLAHRLTGADSVVAITQLARLLGAHSAEAPGGPLSSSVYFWRRGAIETAGLTGPNGVMQMIGAGGFMEALNEVAEV